MHETITQPKPYTVQEHASVFLVVGPSGGAVTSPKQYRGTADELAHLMNEAFKVGHRVAQLETVAPTTRAQASELFGAIDRARQSLVAELRRIVRSRSMTPADKLHDGAPLRADLDTLAKFAEALGTAHNLGGY